MDIVQKYLQVVLRRFAQVDLTPVSVLLVVNILLVGGLILLANLGGLPIVGVGNFAFFAVLALLFALWRPVWAFWLLVGLVPLEVVNLAPVEVGLAVRPYQLMTGVLLVALVVHFVADRLSRKLPTWRLADTAVVVFVLAGFVAAVGGSLDVGSALKQAVIVGSFALLYFLARYFVRGPVSARRPFWFLFSSVSVVVLYGIWQNWRFAQSLAHFEIMPGRPNATFSEPDWLGIFTVFAIAIVCAIIYHFAQIARKGIDIKMEVVKKIALFALLSALFTLLIITVARSAWVGAAAVVMVFGLVAIWRLWVVGRFTQLSAWRPLIVSFAQIAGAFVLAIGIVNFANLTTFELANRAVSTTGAQEITVSCADKNATENLRKFVGELPQRKLENIAQLEKFKCKHINLEEIDSERALGKEVLKVPRNDPTVAIRADIYTQSWELIRANWLLGIGWGGAGQFLGTDAHSNALNTSNIFLEIWLSTGIIGLVAFLTLLGSIAHGAYRRLRYGHNLRNFHFALAITLGLVALTIPNLFNAGLLMGWVWIFLGAAVAVVSVSRNRI